MSDVALAPRVETRRLFLALWPDAVVLAGLLGWRERWKWNARASVVRPEKLHLTLHFLGDVQMSALDGLADALALPLAPCRLQFGTARLWPHGVAVLEPEAVPDELLQLHAQLSLALRGQGLPTDERAFRPHVTLARRAATAIPAVEGPAISWPIASYSLMESRLGPNGAYTEVRRYG